MSFSRLAVTLPYLHVLIEFTLSFLFDNRETKDQEDHWVQLDHLAKKVVMESQGFQATKALPGKRYHLTSYAFIKNKGKSDMFIIPIATCI